MSLLKAFVVLLALVPALAVADPCGMVSPVYEGVGTPITRIGPQRTYVFYKDGVETYVIRPGFQGKVEEFGMLIPFPTVPALRKVPEEIFTQITAAIDPPEVVVDLRPAPEYDMRMRSRRSLAPSSAAREAPLAYDEVKVLKKEAVGMYEVVVLAAGSANALKRWMDAHGFRYPAGMDTVVNEYVKMKWVFVAEKTRVASKPNSDPKPGMKKVDPSLPKGATFDGYVQAMGFRFKVDKPVVPMRLSPFNAGEKRQIVYYLTDTPVRIDGVPTDRVKRQLTGERLRKNVTQLLPLRVIGGKPSDVSKELLARLKPRRDQKIYNGKARALFASDLLAMKSGELSLSHEEKEKEFLRIGEELNIRGPEIDVLHEAHLEVERDATAQKALAGLEGMFMTVVDGDFPIEYMKDNDLTVSKFKMATADNVSGKYDCKLDGPGGVQPGIRWEAP